MCCMGTQAPDRALHLPAETQLYGLAGGVLGSQIAAIAVSAK